MGSPVITPTSTEEDSIAAWVIIVPIVIGVLIIIAIVVALYFVSLLLNLLFSMTHVFFDLVSWDSSN